MPDVDAGLLRDLLEDAAREAASLALAHARRGLKVWTKAHSSPVTDADMAVDALLKARLLGARPDFGWLSEETTDNPDRLARRTLFIVDPIDGTRALAGGLPDWTISIAVVHDGATVAAALAEPEAGRIFVAAAGQGARVGGRPIVPSAREGVAGARLAGPKPMIEPARSLGAIMLPKVHSLALRFAKVACGEIDAGFAGGKSHDWDLAAADLLVQEAGAVLTGFDGRRLIFNRPDPRHPELVCAAQPLHARLLGGLSQGRVRLT